MTYQETAEWSQPDEHLSLLDVNIYYQPPFDAVIAQTLGELVEVEVGLQGETQLFPWGEVINSRIDHYLRTARRSGAFFYRNKFMGLHSANPEEHLVGSAITMMARAYRHFVWLKTDSSYLNLAFADSKYRPSSTEALAMYKYDERFTKDVEPILGRDLTGKLIVTLGRGFEMEAYWPWYEQQAASAKDYFWDGTRNKGRKGHWPLKTYYEWKKEILEHADTRFHGLRGQAVLAAGGRTGSIIDGSYRPGGKKHGGIEHKKPGARR